MLNIFFIKVTQGWWDELWTQEGFGKYWVKMKFLNNKKRGIIVFIFILVDYIKYRAVDTVLGEWSIVCEHIITLYLLYLSNMYNISNFICLLKAKPIHTN